MAISTNDIYKSTDPVMPGGQDKIIHIYNRPAARVKDQSRLRDFEEAVL